MPASDETRYNQKTMHVVFAVSSVVMLLATVWMLAADHIREWKQYQLRFREADRWTDEARLTETQILLAEELKQTQERLDAAVHRPIPDNVMEALIGLVQQEDTRLRAAAGDEEADVSAGQGAGEKVASADVERIRNAIKRGAESTDIAAARAEFWEALDKVVAEAKRREDELALSKRFATAEHTSKVSELGIAIDEAKPTKNLQEEIDKWQERIDDIDIRLSAAVDYRMALEDIIKNELRGEELAAQKQLNLLENGLARLREKAKFGFWTKVGDAVARAPILDAFNNTEIGIEQIWLPDMTIDYNFSDVARYDRCTTCHRAMDRTEPGSAVDPLYPAIPPDDRTMTIYLATPEDGPVSSDHESGTNDEGAELAAGGKSDDAANLLREAYGFALAPRGQVNEDDVTVQAVLPGMAAARAGLSTGDVIRSISGQEVKTIADVEHYLIDMVAGNAWGEPIEMLIRRGLDHPYTSHPRLDLYVGSMSPHKKVEMGCTICHDGQGSATAFKWASHTPDTPKQADAWHGKHGWFDNRHWTFPMTPRRFVESNCLKCHHDVIELEPTDRFPDPPAPKLIRGWRLIQNLGCFGCHEVNGYDGPDTRVGPDLRLEPNFFAVAQQILRDDGLTDAERRWAESVVKQPEIATDRHRLRESLLEEGRRVKGDAPVVEVEAASADGKAVERGPLLSATVALAEFLKDVDAPGEMRKVGPSLRFVRDKVGHEWLDAWIRDPENFRPTTTMPQFFGQRKEYEYLDGNDPVFAIQGLAKEPEMVTDVEYTQRMEDIEIRAIVRHLLAASDNFKYLPTAEGVTEDPSVERGKTLFQTRGCLACHSHVDFSGIESTQGPELSRLASKLNTERGQKWLYSWLKDPDKYHVRTIMPNLILDPIAVEDTAGKPTGAVTDPAADIAAFLLSGHADWKLPHVPDPNVFTDSERRALEELTIEWLRGSFSKRKAKRYLAEGIPSTMADRVKVDEKLLIGLGGLDTKERDAQLLEYVGRRSIGKYGCFGCHDIPGFEGAKPIGTVLADWGRKEPSKLAFEQIGRFLATHGIDGKHGTDDDPEDRGDGQALDPHDYDADTGYFVQAMNSHSRHGFIWQKLRMPRSYDFTKTRNKGFNERLRMPKFPIDDEEREAIITFVLGLTNEAPAMKYLYKPTGRERATLEGKGVLRKYHCAGCHFLEMEKWRLDFPPGQFEEPAEGEDYPFLAPHFTEQEVNDSQEPNRRGLLRAYLHGMPIISQETGKPTIVDLDGEEVSQEDLEDDPEIETFHWFTLWRDEIIDGMIHARGQQVLVPIQPDPDSPGSYQPRGGVAYLGNGGDVAMYLFPYVIAAEQEVNPQVQGSEAWGWLPPPLIGEGSKVQTDWLHDFMLDPHPIRPAVEMRMPRYNMSSAEASRVANYFAAVDDADFPYEYDERRSDGYLTLIEQAHPTHLDDAMKIVVDQNYCVRCHYVGDFQPQGAATTLGPRLDQIYRRLRPDYVRRWVGNPKRVLPYTGMPVNIPYTEVPPHFGGISQALYPGTSTEQLDAVVDLLMNFDAYSQRQTQINALVKAAKTAVDGEEATGGGAKEMGDGNGDAEN